jgi:hypothetical protein
LLKSPPFYGIVDSQKLMNRKSDKPSLLTTKYASLSWGKKATLFLAGILTLAALIFVTLVGSLTQPDFWQPVSLVNFAANLIVFFFASLVGLIPLGYGWHIFLSSVEAAVFLNGQPVKRQPIPVSWQFSVCITLHRLFSRGPWCLVAQLAWIGSLLLSILREINKRQPQQRPKSKAPFLLFQQAPLLSAP